MRSNLRCLTSWYQELPWSPQHLFRHLCVCLSPLRARKVINVSHVLKRLNGCCSLNQLTKVLKSFKAHPCCTSFAKLYKLRRVAGEGRCALGGFPAVESQNFQARGCADGGSIHANLKMRSCERGTNRVPRRPRWREVAASKEGWHLFRVGYMSESLACRKHLLVVSALSRVLNMFLW